MTLHTITRHTIDGEIEYHDVRETMLFSELPSSAVHRTGGKAEAFVVDMEPDLPPYCIVERDVQGNPKKAFNFFDASGYFTYAVDDRIKKAEQSVSMLSVKRDMDWKKMLTIAACGVIVALVFMRFMA